MEKTILKYLADDGVTWLPFTGDVPAPTASIVVKGVPIGDKDGTNKVFTTPQPYVAGTLQLYINGLAQSGFVTEVSPNTGVFSVETAPAASDDLSVYFHIANTGVGNADTVDNFHASATSQPNTIPVLNSEGGLDIEGDIYSNGEKLLAYSDIKWVDFVPEFTGISPPDVFYSRYIKIGEFVHVEVAVALVGGSNSRIDLSLPVKLDSSYSSTNYHMFNSTVMMRDVSTTTMAMGAVSFNSQSGNGSVRIQYFIPNPGTVGRDYIGGSSPWVWANGDTIALAFAYKAES